jgi:lipoprotein-anchoring transpeptidase ErfK/SrfK
MHNMRDVKMQTRPGYGQSLLQLRKQKHLRHVTRALLVLFLASTMVTLLSACNSGDPQAQQQASQNSASLDKILHYAQTIGTPSTDLKPVLQQELSIKSTNAPFTLFNGTAATTYYTSVATRYKQLTVQTQGIIDVDTQQMGQQAQDNLGNLQHTLAAKQHSDLPLNAFTQLYDQQQARMQKAQYPKDFTTISAAATNAISTITILPGSMDKLQTLDQVITLMKQGKQDVTTLQKNYDDDKNAVDSALTPQDLKLVNQTIDTQNQQATSMFLQAIPLLTQARVDDLNKTIQQLKQNGIDITAYQKKLDVANAQVANVKTMQDYQTFSKQIDSDLASMQGDILKGQATSLIKQFHAEVATWGKAHQYLDKYNGVTYPLDTAYMTNGIGEDLDNELINAVTATDYQQTLTDTQNALFHLHMMETDAQDKTPSNQVHATDQKLLNYYKLNSSQVIVVSFIEESLRVYDNGKLVHSFLITAGRPELPPVPGLWSPLWRLTNTTFKSSYPKGSPFWYPDTPINYAIMYHQGGYFLHDSWWRDDYGPGTQFYHIDSSGNVSADYGSHGCINMPEDQAAWVYDNTSYNTQIIMY